MLLSVSKLRGILRGKTETKSAPKTIFTGNGNGLNNFLKYTRTKECPYSVCKRRLGVCLGVIFMDSDWLCASGIATGG